MTQTDTQAPAADHARRVYESIFDMLPSEQNPSPIVRIGRLNPSPDFRLYAKLEWMNPFGSLKDRAAWALLQQLENEGAITADGQRGILEPTSGNTGLSLATMASALGYRIRAVVPNRVPLEKKVLLKISGAELEVIHDEPRPAPELGDGAVNHAKARAETQPDRFAMPNQYENQTNVNAHIQTTGPEIWRQTDGEVTHVFLALGTCGTATGVAFYLRERNPDIKIIAVQPTEGHDVPGVRNLKQLHTKNLLDESLIDEILEVDFELAYTRALELARVEGLLAGPSSGLVFEGACQYAERHTEGLGVMIFADNIFKYTTNMIKHIPELVEGTSP